MHTGVHTGSLIVQPAHTTCNATCTFKSGCQFGWTGCAASLAVVTLVGHCAPCTVAQVSSQPYIPAAVPAMVKSGGGTLSSAATLSFIMLLCLAKQARAWRASALQNCHKYRGLVTCRQGAPGVDPGDQARVHGATACKEQKRLACHVQRAQLVSTSCCQADCSCYVAQLMRLPYQHCLCFQHVIKHVQVLAVPAGKGRQQEQAAAAGKACMFRFSQSCQTAARVSLSATQAFLNPPSTGGQKPPFSGNPGFSQCFRALVTL